MQEAVGTSMNVEGKKKYDQHGKRETWSSSDDSVIKYA